jgi:hypothetical protein
MTATEKKQQTINQIAISSLLGKSRIRRLLDSEQKFSSQQRFDLDSAGVGRQ